MGYFRILLIPVFVIVYLKATTISGYIISAAIIAVSGLTDMLDGFVARKFNMITTLGKALDPIADKLTQCTIMICLALKYKWIWGLVLLFIIKESYMGIMNLILIKKGHKIEGAILIGKICTAVLYISMFLLIAFPSIPSPAAYCLILCCLIFMILSLYQYRNDFKRRANEGNRTSH